MSSPVRASDHNTLAEPDSGTTYNNEPVAVATDSDSDTENSVADDTNPASLTLKMLNLYKEILIMVLIAVAYAALTNERPPKVSKSPAAYPFFSRDSLIVDWYKGQITDAIEGARSSDIAFVMFYAPWDAESQRARREFEIAAQHMHEEVSFVAVNCWQPGSECKRQYSKVYKWPVLIAYPTHGRGIQYNGPLEAYHMIKFLQNVCRPLIRPNTVSDLIGKHDVVIVASIDAFPGSYEYAVFYSTALRFLEKDPFRDTIFAVIPQSYNSMQSIVIYNWNGTVEYEGDLTSELLTTFINKNAHQVAGWISPTGMKSLTLSGFMQSGPTLILFTPKNPLLEDIDYYNMMREVAYDYFNCANSSYVLTRRKLVSQERLKSRENFLKLKHKCINQHLTTPVLTNLPNIWTNTSFKDICNCAKNEVVHAPCPETDPLLLQKEPVKDRLSSAQLLKNAADRVCNGFSLAQKYSRSIFESDNFKKGINITGMSCSTNSTLKFVAVDSLKYYQFAETLGLNLKNYEDKSGVVIVNEKMETHHVMAANVTSTNLRSFIYNFHRKALSRSLLSKVHIKRRSSPAYPLYNCAKTNNFCLTELTSKSFLPTILQNNKVVIVFYYSKQCSFCNGISYTFLTIARMLQDVDDIVFARIDGDLNLLPWEYTMESYPTILFFPTHRKSESRAFPKNIPITVPNLMGFIMANVEPVLKLKIMWSVCGQASFQDDKTNCMTSLRIETLSVIGKTLREWRNSTRKHKVLYKLQLLRHMHLLIAHSPDETSKIRNYFKKLES